ncbi:MAG: 30S ribosome-binding factor RbfA [Candidatus Krumholzibacteria bacterium]|nr:30S ribosome-binding factor RbfA [Candidatus Krumholzibacteria bacterium]
MGEKQKARIEETIHQMVAELLIRRVKDPRVSHVSITHVAVSKDYAMAKLMYNVVGGSEDLPGVQSGLESCRGFIRSQIRKHLRLRVIPELVFVYDTSLDRAMAIDELLKKIGEERSTSDGREKDE